MDISIKLSNKVFKPTGTSKMLFESAVKQIKKVSKILDLGCGSGYVGLSIAKNTKVKNKYYFSDISIESAKLTKINSNTRVWNFNQIYPNLPQTQIDN